jgi:hypothetical protein
MASIVLSEHSELSEASKVRPAEAKTARKFVVERSENIHLERNRPRHASLRHQLHPQ